jgi:hypothetical protein
VSSEQIAREIYEKLGERDRQAVDAWRALGNDWAASLLNSGVLSQNRGGRPADDVADWQRRMLGTDPALVRQLTCEHEAAHAVVAHALGLRGIEAEIDEGGRTGRTRYEKGTRAASSVIAIAPTVWVNEFRWSVFPAGDNGCDSDMRQLVRATSGWHHEVLDAQRRARVVLGEYRDLVLATADRLARDGRLSLPA